MMNINLTGTDQAATKLVNYLRQVALEFAKGERAIERCHFEDGRTTYRIIKGHNAS